MKILFTDLDGTLLNDKKEIPAENLDAIHQTLKKGNAVVITTGRSLSSASAFMEELGLTEQGCYAIVYNGGIIYDCHNKKIVYKKTLSLPDVSYIFLQAEKFGLHCQTYQGNYVVTAKDSPELLQYKQSTNMQARIDPELLFHLEEEPAKVLTSCLDDHARHEAYRASMETWAKGKVSIFFSSDYYLEHVSEGVSKGNAIKILCEHLQIPLSMTVGAGDAENDISMLDTVGAAVCMKNGTEEVKAHADYITTLDNNQGGVAEIIRQFM